MNPIRFAVTRMRTRTTRRLSVVATLTCLGGLIAFSKWFGPDPLTSLALPVFLLGTFGFMILTQLAGSYGLERSCYGWRSKPTDERMLKIRDRALGRAYGVMSMLFLAAIAGWLPVPATLSQGNFVFWAAFLLVWSLPYALIIWNEPDPLTDDEPA